jgi:hypothetical protein
LIKWKKISAVLPMKEFNAIIEQLEDLEDVKLYDEGKNDNEPSINKIDAFKQIEEARKKLGK